MTPRRRRTDSTRYALRFADGSTAPGPADWVTVAAQANRDRGIACQVVRRLPLEDDWTVIA